MPPSRLSSKQLRLSWESIRTHSGKNLVSSFSVCTPILISFTHLFSVVLWGSLGLSSEVLCVSLLCSLLMFVGAFFVTVTIAGYKYGTQSQQHDPNQWPMPPNGRRSQCNVIFEIALPGVISAATEACYDDIASNGRPVPFPQHVISKERPRKLKKKHWRLRAVPGVRA